MITQSFLTVGGAQIFVRSQGEGEPVLFLHGNPDSSALWMPVFEQLAKSGEFSGYHCLAPDLPGFGQSNLPADFSFDKTSLANFIEQTLDALAIRTPVTLVVHDFGGIYGLAFATAYPDLVKRILITNTLFFPDYRWHFLARLWRMRGVGELTMATMNPLAFQLILRLGSRKLTGRMISEIYHDYRPSVRKMVLQLYRAADPADFALWEQAYLKIAERIPVRVVWGENDPFIEKEFADRFGTDDVHVLKNCGHWVPLEEPERTADLLIALVKTY